MSSPRRTFRGAALRAVAIGVLVAMLLILVAVATPIFQRSPSPAAKVARTTIRPAVSATDSQQRVSPSISAAPEKNNTEPLLHRRLKLMEQSIVRIESGEAEVTGLGTGFVIEEGGMIATNFHVLAEATSARARFKNGAAYEIDGYAAVDPQLDLAIVRLRDPPSNLTAVTLSSEPGPAQLAEVVAIGHPQGIEFSPFDGKVSRVLLTSELPGRSQKFLRKLIGGEVDPLWIQHTAKLTEGNSGGPLLNEQGAVIGINTWVDKESGFGYALHVQQLQRLAMAMNLDVVPLAKLAKQHAKATELLRRLTVEHLQETFAKCQAFQWRPVTDEDFEHLQQLAWIVTAVNLPKTFALEALEQRSEDLIRKADQITQQLGREKWDSFGQITLINEHASNQISRSLVGQFFFATVERLCEGDNGTRGAIMKLAGSDQMLFVPLEGQLMLPTPGTVCLVLGINYEGQVVRYGDNPLKLVTAPIIVTRTILPLD